MATDFTTNVTSVNGAMLPSSTNTPLDIRTVIETIDEIKSIPRPFVGMLIYVKDEKQVYQVESLKAQILGPITRADALVDEYSKLSGIGGGVGKSAYDLAVENGYVGTINEWLESLKGEKGADGEKGEKGEAFVYENFTEEQLSALKGPKGDDGTPGKDGLTTEIKIGDNTYQHANGTITLPDYPTLDSLGAAANNHDHNGDYYTEDEIDTKVSDLHDKVTEAIEQSNEYTDSAISNLVNSAPDAMNTLKELADAINAHQNVYEGYVATVTEALSNKSDKDHSHPTQTSVSGNAGTATKLATARTITIGNKANSFDGSANLSYTLADIGAAASSHNHDDKYYTETEVNSKIADINNTIDTKEATLNAAIAKAKADAKAEAINEAITEAFAAIDSLQSTISLEIDADVSVEEERSREAEAGLLALIDTKADIDHTHTAQTSVSGNAGTATKLKTARNITIGNKTNSFDGSAAISFTLADIGAAATSHGDHVTFDSTNTPKAAGTAAVGTATTVSRSDHVHPSQTTVSGNAGTATKLKTARTLSWTGDATGSLSFDGSANASAALTLATSGVTAGNYGPSANATATHGGTISVPYITVDDKGRVTSASTTTITLPSDNNTDTKVTNTLNTTAKAYITGTTSATTNTGTQVFDTGVYLDTTAGKLVATTFAGALSGNASTATKLKTARNITIGSKTNSFDGSAAISFTLADIGAISNASPVFTGSISMGRSTSEPTGTNSTALGTNCVAVGNYSFATGSYTKATEDYAFAEGNGSEALGESAHAEGIMSTAYGLGSHSEGISSLGADYTLGFELDAMDEAEIYTAYNTAQNKFSLAYMAGCHVEGIDCLALEEAAHAEGKETIAYGSYSHAEGWGTEAQGASSHAEGDCTKALGDYSHAEGYSTYSTGEMSHSQGRATTAYGSYSHAEGYSEYPATVKLSGNFTTTNITSKWSNNPSQGFSLALGDASHVEGTNCLALSATAHAEGLSCVAQGSYSHAEGRMTQATGTSSHAEGATTVASGETSHAEGGNTKATNYYAHAEGTYTTASGQGAHAEGNYTTASGNYAHAEGMRTTASGANSHAAGYYTTSIANQYTIGHYNDKSLATAGSTGGTTGTAFTIGNGTSTAASNACRITYAGEVIGKAAYASTGADYAEYFEWLDGNINNEDRRGLFVTVQDGKIRVAQPNEYVLGVVSANPCVLGDNDMEWQGQFLKDKFGAPIIEEIETVNEATGEKEICQVYKINPDYDPNKPYIFRQDRQEWDAIGFMGKLVVIDDGTCEVNGFAKVGENGIATKSDNWNNAYMVLERIDENTIRIVLK